MSTGRFSKSQVGEVPALEVVTKLADKDEYLKESSKLPY